MSTTFPSLPARALRAHAIKNCLSVVKAINKLVEPELCEASRRRMERSHEALKRMLVLLDQDLVVEGGESTELAFVSADEVIRSALARVEDVAEAAAVDLFVLAGPGGVVGDAAALAEALSNVVLNAIQATSSGGAVFLSTYERPDSSQLWMVQDTGRGMSEEILAQLGTPGFSRRRGGSGLGVAGTREIVRRHGGQTRVESQAGSGTVVSIWLPSEPPRGAR
jgi:signal transduction histidine kinase